MCHVSPEVADGPVSPPGKRRMILMEAKARRLQKKIPKPLRAIMTCHPKTRNSASLSPN